MCCYSVCVLRVYMYVCVSPLVSRAPTRNERFFRVNDTNDTKLWKQDKNGGKINMENAKEGKDKEESEKRTMVSHCQLRRVNSLKR